MSNPTFKVLKFFMNSYPCQTALVVISLFFMALMEALGIATILPLITMISDQPETNNTALNDAIASVFGFFNIPLQLPYLLGFIIVTMVLKSAMMTFAMFQVAESSARVVSDLRFKLLNSIMNVRWSHYSDLATGESVNAMGSEAIRSADVYRQTCNVLAYLLLVAMYTLLALALSWKLTITATFVGAFILIIFKPMISFGRHYGNRETQLLASSSQKFTEALANVKPVRAMEKGKHYTDMLSDLVHDLAISQKKKLIATDTIRNLSEPIIIIFCSLRSVFFNYLYRSLHIKPVVFGIPLSQNCNTHCIGTAHLSKRGCQ